MQRRGRRTPLDNEPECDAEVVWFLRAYDRLGASRPVSMGVVGAIPVSEMIVYWKEVSRVGPVGEFIDIIQAVDASFLQRNAPSKQGRKA
jgi:hypothetical protein